MDPNPRHVGIAVSAAETQSDLSELSDRMMSSVFYYVWPDV